VTLLDSLHRHFGYDSFRPGQEDLVRAVIDGRDVLAVMPTGSGKSLGFQLPAVVLPGTTLVVSPLISLMKDQVDELNRRGIPAAALHSMLSADERRSAFDAARRGGLRLLYVAPERFASDYFLGTLRDIPVSRFVIDEAHCVSEWGHDFRPDYRRLRAAAQECRRADGRAGRPPLAAFTATATPEVRDDIVDLLGLAKPSVIVSGFDRPNIALHVRPVGGDWEKQELLPQLVGQGRALVYTSTRKSAENAATTLRSRGVKAEAYHAGLPDDERVRVQDAFASGDARVVCATNAFGMGIDRPDVEAVIHADVPGSIEAYYQEIGRAGRDGRHAVATLLWNYADVKTREFLIDRGRDEIPGRPGVEVDPDEIARRKDLEHKKLKRMVAYATTAACLRATILRYFGDPAAQEPCGACGNCDRRAPLDEGALEVVRKVLAGVARSGERFGRRRIAAMLVGQIDDLPDALRDLSTTGILSSERLSDVEHWIDSATGAGLLAVSTDQYRTLSLTAAGRDVMAGRSDDLRMTPPAVAVARHPKPRLVKRPAAGGRREVSSRQRLRQRSLDPDGAEDWLSRDAAVPAGPDDAGERDYRDAAMEKALRAWRLGVARQRGVPPYVVLHDKTLLAIVAARPQTLGDLLDVPGMGPAKAEQFGAALLALLAR